ncbi:hypothetical protein [Marinomonas ostreistagni]|uniref:hypothetical protein n=1 Tax=Marinomonas ostreistagni TaxID=359209 RepID=UPI00195222F2|nr:hypothetical protein [Marinomonas ostreistagni]MBM6551413.1 hypothetical protein [Marinomonas ostreistagni]
MSSVANVSTSYAMEMMGVAMAKTQQEEQGRQSLQLLESAASSSQQIQTSSAAPVGNVGQNINIKV